MTTTRLGWIGYHSDSPISSKDIVKSLLKIPIQITTKINENESLLMTGCNSLDDVCVGLNTFGVDYAIVARDMYINFNEILMKYGVKIVGEEVHVLKYYLIGISGVRKEEIDSISMHPLTSSHCASYLKSFPNAHTLECCSLLGTIKSLIDNNNKTRGIITTDISCLSYGLDIIEALSDDCSTRFVLLARDCRDYGSRSAESVYKTTLVFSLQNSCDINYILCAAKDVSVTHIESLNNSSMLSLDFVESGAAGNDSLISSLNDKIVYNASYLMGDIQYCIRDYMDSWLLSLDDLSNKTILHIGIVGFGTFGQFISKRFKSYGHNLYCIDKDDVRQEASSCGCKYYSLYDTEDILAFFANPLDVVVLAISIVSFHDVLTMITSKNLLKNQLVVDVLSIKLHAKSTLLNLLPQSVDILSTHPMFGPSSAKYSWHNKNLMFEKVRIRDETLCDNYLNIFRSSGCQMIEISSELHDEYAARTQFVTHFICRVLAKNGYGKTPIDTVTWTNLNNIVQNISNNSDDLFYGLYCYNRSNTEREMLRIKKSVEDLCEDLLERAAKF